MVRSTYFSAQNVETKPRGGYHMRQSIAYLMVEGGLFDKKREHGGLLEHWQYSVFFPRIN